MLIRHDLEQIAINIRKNIISSSFKAETPHIGSALSCVDLLASAFWEYLDINGQENEDVFILSKGHAALALYATLHAKGIISSDIYKTFAQNGSPLPEHPIRGICPTIQVTSGSLGHGIGIGLGIAKAIKLKHENRKVVVLMSDGECNEGSVWEAALLAPNLEIDNFTVIIDNNKWQATARTSEINQLEPLLNKWIAFGWDAYSVDGHDYKSITMQLNSSRNNKKPLAIIAQTTKGKGISFMEDDNNWHYKLLDQKTYKAAMEELCEMPLRKQ